MDSRSIHGLVNIIPSRGTRTELLAWLNDLMPQVTASGYEVPRLRKVEHCGNGVPYVLLLPQMLPSVHPALISRAKVPAKHDFEAVSNLKLMSDALLKNGIPPPDVLVDEVDKLIKGAFQANLQLLQWFRGLGDVLMPPCGQEQCQDKVTCRPQLKFHNCDASENASLVSEQSLHSTFVGSAEGKLATSRGLLHSRTEAMGLKGDAPEAESVGRSGKAAAGSSFVIAQGVAAATTLAHPSATTGGIKRSPASRRTSTPVDKTRAVTSAVGRRILDPNSTGLRGTPFQSPATRGRSNPCRSLAGKEGGGVRPCGVSACEAVYSGRDAHKTPLSTSEFSNSDGDATAVGEVATAKAGNTVPNIVRRGRDQPTIPPKNELGCGCAVSGGAASESTLRAGRTTPMRSQTRGRNSFSSGVNPATVRERWAVEPHAASETVGSPLMPKNTSGKLLQSTSAATPSMSAGISRSGSRGESSSEGDSAAAAAALLKATRERQFYYDKLRQVEAIVLPLADKSSSDHATRDLVNTLLDVLYAAE